MLSDMACIDYFLARVAFIVTRQRQYDQELAVYEWLDNPEPLLNGLHVERSSADWLEAHLYRDACQVASKAVTAEHQVRSGRADLYMAARRIVSWCYWFLKRHQVAVKRVADNYQWFSLSTSAKNLPK